MNEENEREFAVAWQAANDLLARKKWNVERVYVLNRFGSPVIEAFVPDADWEALHSHSQATHNGFKVVFSKARAWNPAYERNT